MKITPQNKIPLKKPEKQENLLQSLKKPGYEESKKQENEARVHLKQFGKKNTEK